MTTNKPTQKTPKGYKIPIPKRSESLRKLTKAALPSTTRYSLARRASIP
jgi:hypothetical protein